MPPSEEHYVVSYGGHVHSAHKALDVAHLIVRNKYVSAVSGEFDPMSNLQQPLKNWRIEKRVGDEMHQAWGVSDTGELRDPWPVPVRDEEDEVLIDAGS